MANCQNLQIIRLSANQLTNLPDWLLALPQLAWLAFAGNPLRQTYHFANPMHHRV
ncbi:MAG: hypothetical protein U9N57_03220 [Pseudomonadota bacterium]|nr:hypothetical protein [Pseudomonadota bacterium]